MMLQELQVVGLACWRVLEVASVVLVLVKVWEALAQAWGTWAQVWVKMVWVDVEYL